MPLCLFQLMSWPHLIHLIISAQYNLHGTFSTSAITWHWMLLCLSRKKSTLSSGLLKHLGAGDWGWSFVMFLVWANIINHSWRCPPCASCKVDEHTSGQLRTCFANALKSWRVVVPPQSELCVFIYFYSFIYNLMQFCSLTVLCARNFTASTAAPGL